MRQGLEIVAFATALGMIAMTASPSDAAPKAKALSGVWGGDRMILTMGPKGGQIDMDCASGTISSKIMLDAKGRFVARGTFEEYSPGPVRAEDFAAQGKPVAYRGQVIGNTLKLAITRPGSATTRNYTLRQGEKPRLVRCL